MCDIEAGGKFDKPTDVEDFATLASFQELAHCCFPSPTGLE